MLLERDSAGDRERAREMLAAALETYAGIALPRHCDLARGLHAQARAIVPNISAPPSADQSGGVSARLRTRFPLQSNFARICSIFRSLV